MTKKHKSGETGQKNASHEHDEAGSSAQSQDPKDAKIADLTDTLQRLQADFENYKKRDEKERSNFSKYANQKLLESFLPLLDSFELAIKNGNSHDTEKFRKGIEMIFAQLYSIMEANGVIKIDALGNKFDPHLHEVLMQADVEDPSQDDAVLEEFQKGYMLNGSVLRHSKVKIGRKKCREEEKDEGKANGKV